MASNGYTQVDHLYQDFIAPILSPSERACMDYIIRRTAGFANKERDVIAISQFVDGITVGSHVLDLGAGLKRTAAVNALRTLEEKGLVVVRYACTSCGWEQKNDDELPAAQGSQASPQCPRCHRSLTKSYARSPWTIQKVIDLLNAHEREEDNRLEKTGKKPLGIVYSWDSEVKRILREQHGTEEDREERRRLLREEALRLMDLIWHPALINQLIKDEVMLMKTADKMHPSRVINEYYKPVIKLQEDYPMAALVEYGLKAAVKKSAEDRARKGKFTWEPYTRAVCRRHENEYKGVTVIEGSNADRQQKNSIGARKDALQHLLGRAAALNDKGEQQAARELLSELLSDAMIDSVKELFDGDKEKTEYQIRLAYKQGTDDFQGVTYFQYGADYYPEWTPET